MEVLTTAQVLCRHMTRRYRMAWEGRVTKWLWPVLEYWQIAEYSVTRTEERHKCETRMHLSISRQLRLCKYLLFKHWMEHLCYWGNNFVR
jgi:hypothetical protein